MTQQEMSDTIKGILKTIRSIRHVYGINELPVSVNEFPAALLVLGPTDYHFAHTGGIHLIIRILLLFTKGDVPTALNKIPPYIAETGDDSVSLAIETGTNQRFHTISNTGSGFTQWGGGIYISTEFEIECLG